MYVNNYYLLGTGALLVAAFIVLLSLFPIKSFAADAGWQRSYSDDKSTRYSALKGITSENVQNLEQVWVYDFISSQSVGRKINQATPVLAGNILVTTSVFGKVYGLNPKTGQEIWQRKLPSPVAKRGMTSKRIGSGYVVFVPTPKGIYALNVQDGSRAKHVGVDGFFPSNRSVIPPVVSDTHVFVAAFDTGGVQAFELFSGKEVWTTLFKSGNIQPRVWSGFSYDQQTDLLFVVTSDPGGLFGKGREYETDYSSSLLALSGNTGEIKWQFQETFYNVWDFDLVGSPIIADIEIDGVIKRTVIALSKTGNIIVLDLITGKPVYKNGMSLINVPQSNLKGEQVSRTQRHITIPKRISQIKLDPKTDFRIDNKEDENYIKLKTRRGKYGEYIPVSHDYDVILYGLHGGANRTGGALFKEGQSLIVPANHDPWFFRLFYTDKINRVTTKNQSSFFKGLADVLGFYHNSKNGHEYGWVEQVYSHLPIIGRNKNYKAFCASCHGLARQGFVQSESEGGGYFPSLLGIVKSDRFDPLKSMEAFNKVHQYSEIKKTLDSEVLNDIKDYIESADNFLIRYDLLKDEGKWQLFLGRDGHPATKGPWGTITSVNLQTGEHNWRVPFGRRVDKQGRVIVNGDINFGGVLASAGRVVFATGTTDGFARAYSADTGKLLWEDRMPLPGSTSPMTYLESGCQVVVFNATGGDFAGFENGSGSLVAYKDKNCKFTN